MKRYLWLLFVAGTALGVGSMAIARVAPSIGGGSGNGRIKSINAGSQVNVSDDGQGNVTISATPPSQGSAGDSIASSTIVVINADNEGSGDGYISMRINNSTKAVVAPNGRVGINTTNPSTELEVGGVITATSIDANLAANKVQAGALGASVMGSSVAAQSVNGDSLKSTNKATDGLVPKFDAATGGVTWSADNAGGGGSGGGTTSSTMVVIQGGTSGNDQNIISFQNDTSTLGYLNRTGTWRFGSIANRLLLIASNSWTSVGTTAPEAPLHIFPNSTDGNNSGVVAVFDSRALNASNKGRIVLQPPSSPTGGFKLDFGSPGSASASMVYNQDLSGIPYRYLSFDVGSQTDIMAIRGTKRIGINTTDPITLFHISSAAGTSGPMMIVSTGTSNLFEVNGTSIVAKVQLFSPDGSPYSTTSVSGSGGPELDALALSQVGRIVSTNTVGLTWLTITSGTAYGQLSVGSITVVSAGAGVINSTHAVMKIKVTDLSDDDFEVAEDSASVNGVRVSTYQVNTVAVLANHSLDATGNGNVISFRDQDRFTSPSFASGTFVTYIATPTMGISSSTIGHFQFSNAISSQANFAVYAWIPPSDIDLTANVILSSFGVILGGADTGTQRYMVAISTSMDGRPARETMFSSPYSWLESITVDVGADSAGINGYLQVVGNTTLTSWQTRIIPGALHYITVMRDGDAAQDSSTIDSYSSFFSVSYKRRLAQ